MEHTPQVEFSGFWRRFNAYGIDATIVLVISLLVAWVLGIDADASAAGMNMQTFNALLTASQGGAVDPALVATLQDALTRSLTGGSFVPMVDDYVFMAVSAAYNILFVAGKWHATPGKYWLNLKVTGVGGTRLTLLHSALRHAASGISMYIGGLGYLTMFFTREKLALHDMLCRTRVFHHIHP